jgi:hypothetical protein
MIQGILLQEPIAKTSVNLFNELLTLNEPNQYTITSGIGVAEITNSTDRFLYGKRSMKVRFFSANSVSFNLAQDTNSEIKNTGVHYIQYAVYKEDPTAEIELTVRVYINDNITDDRTIGQRIKSDNGFIDGNWNVYYQSFLASEGDIVSLDWTIDSEDANAVIYTDGYKLEFCDQNLIAPTFYTEPPFLPTKWQRRLDLDNTQTLVEDELTEYGFSGTIVTSNTDLTLVNVLGQFIPRTINSLFTVNINFLVTVPTGSDLNIECYLKGYDTATETEAIIFAETINVFKLATQTQYVNVSFIVPTTQDFLDYAGRIYLMAKGNDIEISNRSITAIEQINSN